jgi:hypothetical protein
MAFPTSEVARIIRRDGDYTPFTGLDYASLEHLVAIGAARSDDRHNQAPKIGDLLARFRNHPSEVVFGGYVIWPPRADSRVSVDEIVVSKTDGIFSADIRELWGRSADEDEDLSRSAFRLWWD